MVKRRTLKHIQEISSSHVARYAENFTLNVNGKLYFDSRTYAPRTFADPLPPDPQLKMLYVLHPPLRPTASPPPPPPYDLIFGAEASEREYLTPDKPRVNTKENKIYLLVYYHEKNKMLSNE